MLHSTLMKWFLRFHRLTAPYGSDSSCINHVKFSLMALISAYPAISFIYHLTIHGFSRKYYVETLFQQVESWWAFSVLIELFLKRHDLGNYTKFLNEPFHQFGPASSDQEVVRKFTLALAVFGAVPLIFTALLVTIRFGTPLVYFLWNYSHSEFVEFPLPVGYIPMKTDSNVIFSLFILLGFLHLVVACLAFSNWALSFAYGTFKIVAQLKILNLSLLKLNDHIDHRYMVVSELAQCGASRFNEDLYEHCVFECLKESIKVHQKIISNRKLLEHMCTRTTLIFLLSVTFHMAFQAIELSRMKQFPTGIMLLGAIINLSVCLGQLLTLSYCGQTIIDESEALRFSLYDCTWLDKPTWFKKQLLIMMAVATRPIRVTACGLHVLQMQLVYHTLSATYSFFNVILSVQKH